MESFGVDPRSAASYKRLRKKRTVIIQMAIDWFVAKGSAAVSLGGVYGKVMNIDCSAIFDSAFTVSHKFIVFLV